MPRSLIVMMLVGAFTLASHAQKIEKPHLTPSPSTEHQKELIAEGTKLHDQHEFEAAISKYEQVLKENPDNVLALYEMAFSYFGKKDYNKSIEISAQALKYKSDLLGPLIVQIGNAQDELGSPEKAVETYKAGIKLSPSFALLHYNMAISLQRLKKPAEARTAVKKAVSLDPNHPGSHRLLSALFYQEGYKTPALLAAYRFLVLEPSTDRAGLTLEIVKRVMQGGVNPGKNPNEINIFVDMAPAKKDEGDFSSLDLFLGLARAANYTEKNRNKSQAELEIDNLSSLIAMLDESKADRSSFTWKYYVPYFIELKKRGFVEPFWYYTNQRSGIPGVSEWLNTHVGKLSQFLVWSKSYNWSVVS